MDVSLLISLCLCGIVLVVMVGVLILSVGMMISRRAEDWYLNLGNKKN